MVNLAIKITKILAFGVDWSQPTKFSTTQKRSQKQERGILEIPDLHIPDLGDRFTMNRLDSPS